MKKILIHFVQTFDSDFEKEYNDTCVLKGHTIHMTIQPIFFLILKPRATRLGVLKILLYSR